MLENVILVDESDHDVGSAEKLDAHRTGKLHRAFSIFVFNPTGQLLLQQRAAGKYHSAGLWSNTCCSHPRPGFPMDLELKRKLRQEMGIDCDLQWRFNFQYRIEFGNGLIEHEFDHVYFGRYEGDPNPNPDEVEAWKWVDLQTLDADIKTDPEAYTYWLRICIDRVLEERNFFRS